MQEITSMQEDVAKWVNHSNVKNNIFCTQFIVIYSPSLFAISKMKIVVLKSIKVMTGKTKNNSIIHLIFNTLSANSINIIITINNIYIICI